MSPNKWQFEHMRQKVEKKEYVSGGALKLVKVSGRSHPFLVAGAIAKIIREKNDVIVQAMGNEAVYLAVKSMIYATQYLAESGISILSRSEYAKIDNGDLLCVRFTVRVLPSWLVYEDSVETGLHEEDLF